MRSHRQAEHWTARLLRPYAAALERRVAGESVHRIMGFREFHGLRLCLSPETLEPRPDTESLVDAVLPFVRETAARLGSCRLLDLGTGTGAIALAMLKEVPQASPWASISRRAHWRPPPAMLMRPGLARDSQTIQSDWYAATEGRYHLIVSNPPYIARKEIETLQPEVRNFDPVRALDGGEDGLDCYRIIAKGAGAHLEPGAQIAVEIGYNQRADVEQIFARGRLSADCRSEGSRGTSTAPLYSNGRSRFRKEKTLGNRQGM